MEGSKIFSFSVDGGETIQKAIKHVWTFLGEFIPLANTHGSEFISNSHWENYVPATIQEQLLALCQADLVSLPLGKWDEKITTQQKVQGNHQELKDFIAAAVSCHMENLGVLSPVQDIHDSFKGAVTEAMSEKKLHEVEVMANTVAGLVKTCAADVVVDVGSGKGYLSLELAGHHRLNVLGLDSKDSNTHGAQHRKEKLKTRWPALVARADVKEPKQIDSDKKARESKTVDRYIPVTKYVTADMNLSSILSQQAASLCGDTPCDQVTAVIAGLHTCGSLAVSAMRLFLLDPAAVGLCLVACCYQLMEEDNTVEEMPHFPLSHYGKSLGLHLGRNARNLASQSVHRITASGQLQGEEFYWRALLDVIIDKLDLPHPERITGIRGLNKRSKSFAAYLEKAFEKLSFSSDLLTAELIAETEEKYQEDHFKMAAFFQMKLALAPAVESLILLDRLLFLQEQASIQKAEVVQLFDPVTSPRCFAILASKGNFG